MTLSDEQVKLLEAMNELDDPVLCIGWALARLQDIGLVPDTDMFPLDEMRDQFNSMKEKK